MLFLSFLAKCLLKTPPIFLSYLSIIKLRVVLNNIIPQSQSTLSLALRARDPSFFAFAQNQDNCACDLTVVYLSNYQRRSTLSDSTNATDNSAVVVMVVGLLDKLIVNISSSYLETLSS